MTTPSETDDFKRAAARRALDLLADGMILGLGSGSTAERFVTELAVRVQTGLQVTCVPTSKKSERLARSLGLQLTTLDDNPRLDLTIDGADEVDKRTFDLIKGRGGALLREKLVAMASDREVIVADETKLVRRLGERQPVPVEVVRFGWRQTAAAVERLGCEAVIRQADGQPFVSDEGHFILDCRFQQIRDPASLAGQIKSIAGVVEHGLFVGLANLLVIAGPNGVQLFSAPASRRDGR